VGDECTISLVTTRVSNQNDVDRLLGNCTSIQGTLGIAQNYTGSLLLSNITSISGSILTDSDLDAHSLTSIEAPALTTIEGISISNASTLTNISFSSLSTAQYIAISAVAGLAVEFPQLRSVYQDMSLTGNISRYAWHELSNPVVQTKCILL
jgi:hypothetical protein